jgi:hypothetical protein
LFFPRASENHNSVNQHTRLTDEQFSRDPLTCRRTKAETIVRFLFRGCVRETGKSVEGHVEAANSEAAYVVLAENGIVTESLREDPKALNLSPHTIDIPQIADALESALDSSSMQVSFDDLTARYRGKKVWVIDRDKIRHRVANVVDAALAMSEANAVARQRVASAIRGLFEDNRNIATEHTAQSAAAMRVGSASSGALEQQISRLNSVVEQAEGLIASLAVALRNIGTGGGVARRRVASDPTLGAEQNEVLLEIFKSNLELRRAIADAAPAASAATSAKAA